MPPHKPPGAPPDHSGAPPRHPHTPEPARAATAPPAPSPGALVPQTAPNSPHPPHWHPAAQPPHPHTVRPRRPSYGSLEARRETHYNLDCAEHGGEAQRQALDRRSRFHARRRARTLPLPQLLPYAAEPPRDRARFLAHIVAHLYIAVKSLDVQGSVAVSARDLAALRDSGCSELDVVLETTLFAAAGERGDGYGDGDGAASDESGSDDSDGDGDGGGGGGGDASQHKKPPRSAAVASARVWTHELLVWLKMKYDMPVALRRALAQVYYAVCCSRGQHVGLKLYARAFDTLTKDAALLAGLRLPWEPVYAELALHFPAVDSVSEPADRKDLALLLKVAERAAPFFAPAALPVLFRRLAARFSIPCAATVLGCMRVLPPAFVAGFAADAPDAPLDMRHYLAPLFAMWRKLNKNAGVDLHMPAVLGRVAASYLRFLARTPADAPRFSPHGVFSADQFAYLMNALLNGLSINCAKFASAKTKHFHGFACAIVSSIDGDRALAPGGVMDSLDTLLNAVESYVHPSNTGDWSKPISRLVLSLCHQLAKRHAQEREPDGVLADLAPAHKLSDALVARFVAAVLPLVRTGLQSKRNSAVEEYLAALAHLAHLDAEQTLAHVLLDIYESLQGVISTHRVITALRALENLTRYFAQTPVFRVHLLRILEMILPGIDSNDLTKTIHTLECFATVANFVPYADLTDGDGDPALALDFTNSQLEHLSASLYAGASGPAAADPELEKAALRSSTSSFPYIVKSLAQRLFVLLENIPDPSKSNGIEKNLCDVLPKLVYIIIEAMSDDVFRAFRRDVMRFVEENTLHHVAEVIADICGAIIKRDPAYYKTLVPVLADRIREEIVENGAGKSRTGVDIIPRDQALYWNVMILNSCSGNAGEWLVDMGPQLLDVSNFLMQNIKGPLVFETCYLLNQVLQGATKIRLKETRLISAAYEKKHGLTEACWGGFQFDEYRFSAENLAFDWFIPTEREVNFAVDVFRAHVTKALANISAVVKKISASQESASLELTDALRLNVLYLANGMSGVSYLLDPSFDEDIPQLSELGAETIQGRLRLLQQIREMRTATDDEFESDAIHENLSSIVHDMEQHDVFAIPNESSEDVFEPDCKKGGDDVESIVSDKADDRASPQLEGVEVSSVNPALTFRERKLYTSRYYFGDDIDTRKRNAVYLEIHRLRHLIGKSLHHIFRFMQGHLKDDTRSFNYLLFALHIWFSDVGRERLPGASHAKITFGYVAELQRINKVRKPYTRVCLGSRIEAYHSLRVAMHATCRTMTRLDRALMEDLAKIACSPYSSIADRAQTTLVDSMKRVNGAYGVIVRSALRVLGKAVDERSFKTIESGLALFESKRIRGRLQNDYFNLQKYVELLHRCFALDNEDVNAVAQRSLEECSGELKPPRTVCLIDDALVDAIRPPDEYIDLEVKAVALAKERKRAVYFDKIRRLEDAVVQLERSSTHWKTRYLHLLYLADMQSDIGFETNSGVFDAFTRAAGSDHPLISKLGFKGITRLLNKLLFLSTHGNDLRRSYDPAQLGSNVASVAVQSASRASYYETWRAEIDGPSPTYFVDQDVGNGWLFWDDSITVVRPEPLELRLRPHDAAVVRQLSGIATKAWLTRVAQLWIADNEANFAFQGTDVFTVSNLVTLIAGGFLQHLTLRDVLDVIADVYDRDEKSSHIVVCEMITGTLVASNTMGAALAAERDDFLVPFLARLYERDLTPETKNIWNVFAWWTPNHIDSRRFPRVRDLVLRFQLDPHTDAPLTQAAMLTYIKTVITAVTWATPDPEAILRLCFDNVLNRYEAIRAQIGTLLAVASFTFYGDSFANDEAFFHAARHGSEPSRLHRVLFAGLDELFAKTRRYRAEVAALPAPDILHSNYIYCATTMLSWLKQCLNTSVAGDYQHLVPAHIVPFLLDLMAMKDVCLLGSIDPVHVFQKVSQIPYEGAALESVVAMLEAATAQNLSLLQHLVLGEFTEVVYFKNLFRMSRGQRERVLACTAAKMAHKNAEIREASANTFSGLIHTTPPAETQSLVASYRARFSADLDRIRQKHRAAGLKNIPPADVVVLHGATLGLGALVHAFSFLSPPPSWIPAILTIISNKASGIPGIVGKSAKESLSRFKKTRQDTWHVDCKVFSEAQMEDLEGVLWRSYFI